MESFLARISYLLAGRKKHQWGQSAGIKKGTVENIFKGQVPAGETLSAIAKVENVSVSWLLDGLGPPFIVNSPATDTEAAELLGTFLQDEKGWSGYVLSAGGEQCIVLTLPAQFQHKDEALVEYTIVEIIGGQCGQLAIARLEASSKKSLHYLEVPEAIMLRLKRGEVGNMELIGWREIDGLLSHCPQVVTLGKKVADADKGLYTVKPPELDAEAVCKNVQQLNQQGLRVADATIRALLKTNNRE